MKRNKLMIISAIALIVVVAGTITAFAANAPTEAVPANAAEIAAEAISADDGFVSECYYEVDLETGEVSCDGKVIDTIESIDSNGEITHITATASGENADDITFSLNDAEGDVQYFWIEDGEDGEMSIVAIDSANDIASMIPDAE